MRLRRVVCYYDGRSKWLISGRLPALQPTALHELAYLIPREEEVLSTFAELRSYMDARDVECILVEAQDSATLAHALASDNDDCIFLNMSDGFYPVTASYFPAVAAMHRIRYFGNSAALQLAVQNKYMQYIFCNHANILTPKTFLYDGATCVSDDRPQEGQYKFFVKPFDLANSIGIFGDSVSDSLANAVQVAVRIKEHYNTKALIQEFIDGVSVRVNYISVARDASIPQNIGIHLMTGPPDDDIPFTTFESHLERFARADADYADKAVPSDMISAPLAHLHAVGAAVGKIQTDTEKLVRILGLRDYFSMDYKLAEDGRCYFIEVNTLPFARNAALRAYCKQSFGLTVGAALGAAMVGAIADGPPHEW